VAGHTVSLSSLSYSVLETEACTELNTKRKRITLCEVKMTELTSFLGDNPYIVVCAILGIAAAYYLLVAFKSMATTSRGDKYEDG